MPKDGASDGKKLYTILEYKDVTLTTADGTEKSATTGMVSTYTNQFGSSGDPVSKFSYTYDEWGNITEIQGDTELSTPILYEGPGKVAFGTTTQSAGTTTQSTSTEASVESTIATASASAERILASAIDSRCGERTYTYNEYSEVTKATETYSSGEKYTYEYVYDNGGNILTETVSVKGPTVISAGDGIVDRGAINSSAVTGESENVTTKTHTYVYDEVWKDKLVSYDGKTITYDEFGCPIDYMGSSMTWDIYGSLTSVDNGTDTITYTYMGDGQRRSKTVNGVTTTYHYNNGMLLSETTGDETLRYYYDSTGKVASVIYQKGDGEETGYFYTRNVQGDIIAIYRSSDSTLVGTYEYDLWGKPIYVINANSDTDGIMTKNPFRYRGYYYDNETGFYNLNARYYDPEIRRFISADSMSVLMIATVLLDCKNLFAYSENNPITGKDSSGGVVETVFDVISLTMSIVDVCKHPNDPWAWAGLVGDAVDLIPFATGVGETIKGMRAVAKVADKVDDAHDAAKAMDSVSDTAKAFSNTVPIGGCFIAGTLIKTEDGHKKIEEIEVGDLVYAKDAETGQTGYKEVVDLFRVEATELIHLQIDGEKIVTTPEHPFWVDGYGFKRAGDLIEGEYLENAEGELLLIAKIEKEYLGEPITVYNFEVEDWHTYYVSEEEIFVHNKCSADLPGGTDVAKVDFYVTPAGDAIPANSVQFTADLSLMDNVNGKYLGDSINGPVRVRIEGPHPMDANFNGDWNSDHFVEHIHIEHRKNGISGQWGKGFNNKTTIPLSWIYGDN